MTFKELEGQLARWLYTLSKYDFEIRYRAGKTHANADALLRIDYETNKEYSKSERRPVEVITIATNLTYF